MWSRNSIVALGLLALALAPATANAVVFDVSGGSWARDSGWAPPCTAAGCDSGHTYLNMDWTIDSALVQTFSLSNVGDEITITFGAGKWSEENNFLTLAETDDLDITGVLSLDAPTVSNVMNVGVTGTILGQLSDSHGDLSIVFDPITVAFVAFGFTGAFTIDLSDPTWSCNPGQACVFGHGSETKTISATFTLTALDVQPTIIQPTRVQATAPVATVPEPATLALFGLGLAGIGAIGRRRTVN